METKKESLVMEPETAIDKISVILEQIAAAEDLKKETEIRRSQEIEKINKAKDEDIKILNEEVKTDVGKILDIFKPNSSKLEKFLGMKKIVVSSGEINWSDLPLKINLSSKVKQEDLIRSLQNSSMERFTREKIIITLAAGKETIEKVTQFFGKLKKTASVIIKPPKTEINRDALLKEPEVAKTIIGVSVLEGREVVEIRPRSIGEKEKTPSYLKRIFKKK